MKIINGNQLKADILKNLENEILKYNLAPKLAIILIGDSAESKVYINKKQQAGKQIGAEVILHHQSKFNESKLLSLIETLNNDDSVNGIIIQLPIPGVSSKKFTNLINPIKDVDGLNAISLGNLWQSNGFYLISATALASIHVLNFIANENKLTLKEFLTGKNALIINRSILIGKPLAALLIANNATVTIAHSKTENIDYLLSKSNIVISATGKSGLFNPALLKSDTILIDSGFTRSDGKQHGDIDLSKMNQNGNISWLSPVPGGIGPIGVAKLMENVVKAAIFQAEHLN